jgi:hypothetical protein
MFPLMLDAAHPPTSMPDGYSVAAGYLGGNTPALHVWTDAEWEIFKGRKKLPIFIPRMALNPVPANQTGEQDAVNVVAELQRLNVPVTNAVALDMETVANPEYVNAFRNALSQGGYTFLWVYGSADTVFGNPVCSGYWVADYTGQPFMYDHPDVRATQFKAGAVIDSSTVKDYQYHFHLHRW